MNTMINSDKPRFELVTRGSIRTTAPDWAQAVAKARELSLDTLQPVAVYDSNGHWAATINWSRVTVRA